MSEGFQYEIQPRCEYEQILINLGLPAGFFKDVEPVREWEGVKLPSFNCAVRVLRSDDDIGRLYDLATKGMSAVYMSYNTFNPAERGATEETGKWERRS